MTDPQQAARLAEVVAAGPDGSLPPDVAALLAANPDARREMREQVEMDALLLAACGHLAPPSDLLEWVHRGVRRRRRVRWAVRLAAAAAVIVTVTVAARFWLWRAAPGAPAPPSADQGTWIVGLAPGDGSEVHVAIANGRPAQVFRVTAQTRIQVNGRWTVIEDLRVWQQVVRFSTTPAVVPGDPDEFRELIVQAQAPFGQS